MRRLLALSLALACGCSHPSRTPATRDLVWVAAHYAGGVSCTTNSGYVAPSVVAVLRRERVAVYATAVEGLMLPDSCDAPAYAALHYALIAETDVLRVKRAGFVPRQPPSTTRVDTLDQPPHRDQ